MKAAASARPAHRISWAVFIGLMLFAVTFVLRTESLLPSLVASHFDAAGHPNAFMTHGGYVRFVLALAVGLPLLMVMLLAAVYSNAADMKLPNRDYWLAPQRIQETRAFLIAHAAWFGSLLVAFACFVHCQELLANRRQPPLLSSQAFVGGLAIFLLATAVWVGVFLFALRRPAQGSVA